MGNFRTDEEILSGITKSYGCIGTQCSMIVGAFRKGVNWSDNNPRKGLVDIDKATGVCCDVIKYICPNLIQNGEELKEIERLLRNKMEE